MAESAADRARRLRRAPVTTSTTTTTTPPRAGAPAAPTTGPAFGPDLQGILSRRGIQLKNAATTADPNDPPVLLRNDPPDGAVHTPGLRTQARKSELEKDFFKMDPQQLRDLQERLFLGGFYDKSTKPEDIRLGEHDEETFSAYQKALKRAGAFVVAGNRVTFDQVLEAAGQNALADEGGSSSRGGTPFSPVLTDPSELKRVVRDVSAVVAGEYLPEPVLDQIWQQYRSQEYNRQLQAHTADISGGVVNKLPNFESFAREKIREAAPEKAGAQDLAARAGQFMQLLGGSD